MHILRRALDKIAQRLGYLPREESSGFSIPILIVVEVDGSQRMVGEAVYAFSTRNLSELPAAVVKKMQDQREYTYKITVPEGTETVSWPLVRAHLLDVYA